MNKVTKFMVAGAIVLAAGITSVSVFAASDNTNGTNNVTEYMPQESWRQNRQQHMQEQVDNGHMTQEDADQMNEWMDNNGSCHDNNGTGKRHMRNGNRHMGNRIGRQNERMMNE